jgi:hypothetical protein
MFYRLKRIVIASALLPLAIGCKREALVQQPIDGASNNPAAQKVQQWLHTQPKPAPAGRKAANTLPLHSLQWQDAQYNGYRGSYTVPLRFNSNTGEGSQWGSATLLAKVDGHGNISGGEYLMLLPNRTGNGNGVALPGNQQPETYTDADNLPKGFSGAVLHFDMDGQYIDSKVYEMGKLLPHATANLAARAEGGEDDPSPNSVIQNCADWDWVCVEWYYQTYVNGQLVDEQYLFTTCCGSSGGGGDGGITAEEACQNELNAFVAMGQSMEGPVTSTAVPIGPDAWEARYSWQIYRDAVNQWALYSYELGIMKRPTPQSGFVFQSFRHEKISHVGWLRNTGGTRTYKEIGATTSHTDLNAHIDLTFSVTSSVPCDVSKKNTETFTKSKSFSTIGVVIMNNPD